MSERVSKVPLGVQYSVGTGVPVRDYGFWMDHIRAEQLAGDPVPLSERSTWDSRNGEAERYQWQPKEEEGYRP